MIDWAKDSELWLEIGGKRLEARVWGPPPGDAPTLVLLHEGLGSVGLWRDFPEALAARTGCGVFAWSRAGYGRSEPAQLPRPLDYMEREARRTVPAILDAIGFRSGVFVGHSDGASIAVVAAGSHRDPRLRGLVLMAPHFFTEPEGLASIAEARIAYEDGDLKTRLARHHADVDNAFRGWNDAWLDPAFGVWNIEEYLPAITVPVLAIQGRDDQYGTIAQIDALERGLVVPPRRAILPECRHSPHLDQREATLAAIGGFLEDLNFESGG